MLLHKLLLVNFLGLLDFSLCSFNCDIGFFRIGDMKECKPWLTCNEIKNMEVGDLLGFGAVKQVYKSSWRDHTVAFVYINNKDFLDDFRSGLDFLRTIGPNKFIVQLVGFCIEAHVYITEYYPLGNALNIERVLLEKNIMDLKKRFELCIDYVKIVNFLHNSPLGTRVMCDSNTLNKTLEQYLITSSLSLILNDIDALPEVEEEGILCGHKEIPGNFVAPEQNWPYDDRDFVEEDMPPYDEKIDIWKIPSVCNNFLGKSNAAKVFQYHVYSIHKRCKEREPQNRPTSSEVLRFYENLLSEYFEGKGHSNKDEL